MAILNGTSGDDVINGTADGDTIEGLAGADELQGLGGGDTLRGGDDNDRLWGGEGHDTLEGGGGNDIINDHYGNDLLDGGEGDDHLESLYGGDDILRGGGGNDDIVLDHVEADHVQVDAGADNDRLSFSSYYAADDYVFDMGTGDDSIRVATLIGSVRITLGEGRDIVELSEFFAGSVGQGGSAVVGDFTPGDSGDRVEFLELIARVLPNWDHSLNPFATGHARLLQSGADSLLQLDTDGGGDGYVTVLTFKNVSAAAFTAWNLDGFPTDGTIPAGQTLTGTAGFDILKGAAGADRIEGLEGADVLRGGAGNDVIYGGSGFNQMDGQTGDDVIHGGADGDQIDGGYGTDEIFGGGGSDYITSTRGSDLLDGGDDFDTFFINRGSLTVETVTALGGAGNDRFDLYSYGGSTLIVDGGADSDIVYAHVLAGLAQVTLGTGADRLVLSQFQVGYLAYSGSIVVSDFDPAAGDVLDLDDFASFAFAEWDGSENPFGAGYARLVQNGGDTLLQIDTSGTSTYWRTVVTFQNVAPAAFTAASLSGFAPDGSPPPGQTIVGTPGFDSLQGGGGGDTIDGLDGQDWIEGLGGNDLLRGGLGGDQLFGGTGNDRLEGGDGDDDLDDGSGNDLVFGGEGNDSVNNHRGSDTVDAGAGDDHLSLQRNRSVGDVVAMFAGEGNDTLWLTLYNSAAATIDMGAGDDKVELGPVNGSLSLTLGTGADVVTIPGIAAFYHTGYVELTDFNPAFDSIFMPHFLEAYLEGWDPATNPFATGYARLVQSGADTLVQFDTNGGGDGYSTRLTLLGVHVQTLGAASIGHDVRALFGAGSDETFTFTSPASLAGVTFDGGGGTDRLVLNGQFGSGVAFGPGTFLNMERIELTSAPAGGFNGYDITVANGNLAPNALLTVAGSGLRAGETLVFHGEAATAGRFAVTGGAGDDVIFGGAGNDLLDGGSGADSMRGGTGHDTYVVDNAGDVVEENAGEGSDAVRTSLAVYSLAALPNIEALIGTSASGQTLTGNAASNRIEGAGGNDVIHAWAGGGGDTVLGNGGNDTFFFAAAFTAADTVRGGAGIDTFVIQGPYGSLTLAANLTEIENISILGGNNTAFGEPGTNRHDYVLTTHDSNFAAGVQARINAAALLEGEDFTFNGSAETDASYVVYGGKGKDTLLGGLGNDIFFYAEERFASGDTVNGGAGYDGMFLRGNYTIDFNAPGYTGLFTNIENLTLTSATDERYARGGGTEFDYNLILSDAIVGAGQTLTVSGSLLQANETMVLDGSAETDGFLRLFGGLAADTLKGGGQADLLHGAFGADILAGGGGADVFRYQAVTESYSVARDHIVDFTPGTDRIELDRIDASRAFGGDQAFTWIGSSAFSNTAGELRAFQSGAQWIVQGDINGDGHADLIIALTLQGPAPLGAGDFVL